MGISIKPIRGWKGNMGLKAGWIGHRLVRRLDVGLPNVIGDKIDFEALDASAWE
jgi:hypothetical protein